MKTKYRALDGLRRGKLGRKIDRIEDETETDIDDLYGDALDTFMRRNRKVLRVIQALMDGETKTPAHCITDEQKLRWRQKELERILKKTGLVNDLTVRIQSAGEETVKRIQKSGLDIFKTAHKGTIEQLEG